MGSIRKVFLLLAVIFPVAMVSAKDFMVGDDKGWTINFNYSVWAKGKDFRYPVGAHNVFKVNGTGFQNCIKPPPSEALTTGNDMIVLATPGRKWYICGVGQHCAVGGQKLVINVNPAGLMATTPSVSPSPAMPYTSSSNGIIVNVFQTMMVMLVLIVSIFGV
ncbi:hypothetical protein LguiA_014250 [Lonicera macranthoides]